MANTAVYSSIDELKLAAPKRPGGELVAQMSESERHFSSAVLPPPLPPPNPKSSYSPALAEAKKKPTSNSDESMCQADATVKTDGDLQLSNSSLSLKSLESNSSDQADGSNVTALYATVNKKVPEVPPPVPSPLPPPLPPPLSPPQIAKDTEKNEAATTNGWVPPEGEGIMILPTEEQKSRKPALFPRTHVYETVPDDIAQTQSLVQPRVHASSFSSGGGTFRRKSSKKRKSIRKEKERKSMLAAAPLGVIPLSQLEPLPLSGKTMKLKEFVKRYSHYLPLCVRVDEGYCGTEERFVISSGDIYNFHFVKNERVVSLRDCGENSFSVPLNSAIEFGILYNPNNDVSTARKGYTFRTVSDLASVKSCPKLLRATQAHVANDSKCSVQVDEILIVKKMTKTHVMKKRVLKVFSLTTKEYKTLQEDCEGHFTTTPECVKLYLPEIIEHFGSSFPLEAMLYMRPDSSEELPLHLTSDLVTLTHMATEMSIIASTCWEGHRQDELSEEDRALVAIPTDLDIEVTFLGRESDSKRLDEATRTLFERFSSLKITDMKNAVGMQMGVGSNSAQKKLYKAVRQDCPSNGTEIQLPYRLSGVYDGETSPATKKTLDPESHVYYTLLPEGVEASSTNSLPNSTSAVESKNEKVCPLNGIRTQPCALPSDAHTSDIRRTQPCILPPEPSSPTRHSISTSSATNTSTSSSNSAAGLAINTELSEAYSAIEDLFNSTLSELNVSEESISERNYDYVITDSRQCAIAHPRQPEQVEDCPAVPMRPRKKESVSEDQVAEGSPNISPKMSSPNTRAKSKSVLISERKLPSLYETRERSSSSGELGARRRKGDCEERSRILGFEELSENYATLQREVQELKKVFRMTRELQDYSLSSHQLFALRTRSIQAGNPRPKSEMKASSVKEQEQNVEDLRALDHTEILILLDAMNLGQYKDEFVKEQVDGEILADCDEGMLEQDLHITCAIHRNRLMKIITGKHSAQYFTSTTDKLYSTLDRTYKKEE